MTLRDRFLEQGAVVVPRRAPDDLIDDYCEVRAPLGPDGWPTGTPYMHVPEMRALCLCPEITDVLDAIFAEPMGLHLNLTGWVSTERTAHQDLYLNPPDLDLADRYCGVWIALADIHPDAGPFEYIPGSHRWPILERATVLQHLKALGHPNPESDNDWPYLAEPFVTAHWDQAAAEHDAVWMPFEARRGDVLVWSSKLVHRGSRPRTPGMERRALIAHFSAVAARRDMPVARPENAGWIFVL